MRARLNKNKARYEFKYSTHSVYFSYKYLSVTTDAELGNHFRKMLEDLDKEHSYRENVIQPTHDR